MAPATTESLIWASSSSLLDPLLLRGPRRHQIHPVAGHVPQLADRLWGDEAGPQQLPLGNLAQPDRIQGVGLGTPGEVLDVAGIHQPGLEPVGFQQVQGPLQSSLVASMTTRVTPSSASRSTMTSSQRVIVL